jgi:hypothetical protein
MAKKTNKKGSLADTRKNLMRRRKKLLAEFKKLECELRVLDDDLGIPEGEDGCRHPDWYMDADGFGFCSDCRMTSDGPDAL